MTRRRSTDSGDSLEMLLDTVCNVFGGVIFVAMLIAILTSQTSEAIVTDHRATTTAVKEQRAVNATHARIANLRSSLDEITKTSQTIGTGESKRAQQILELIEQRQEEATKRIEAARQWLDRFAELESEAVEGLDRRLAQATSDMKEQEEETRQVRDAKTIQGRLPVERQTQKTQILFIVWKGQAYAVPLGAGRALLLAGGMGEDVEVDMKPAIGAIIIMPTPGKGIAITAQFKDNQRIAQLMDLLKSDQHFFDLYVTADSVDAFNQLRQFVTAKGFSYNVHPIKPQSGRFIFGRTDKVFVQ